MKFVLTILAIAFSSVAFSAEHCPDRSYPMNSGVVFDGEKYQIFYLGYIYEGVNCEVTKPSISKDFSGKKDTSFYLAVKCDGLKTTRTPNVRNEFTREPKFLSDDAGVSGVEIDIRVAYNTKHSSDVFIKAPKLMNYPIHLIVDCNDPR